MKRKKPSRRNIQNLPCAIIPRDAGTQYAPTVRLGKIVARLHQNAIYSELALQQEGPEAIRLALTKWGGRSLRDLARATGLSPAYLSLVSTGKQRISLAALQRILCECPGVLLGDAEINVRRVK